MSQLIESAIFEAIQNKLDEAPKISKEDIPDLDVTKYKPTQKDIERAEAFQFGGLKGNQFRGGGGPMGTKVAKMAKAIKDPEKLLRRTMAVAQVWGTYRDKDYWSNKRVPAGAYDEKGQDVLEPFKAAMLAMGFSREQIKYAVSYRG